MKSLTKAISEDVRDTLHEVSARYNNRVLYRSIIVHIHRQVDDQCWMHLFSTIMNKHEELEGENM